jgi:hypothetical protein
MKRLRTFVPVSPFNRLLLGMIHGKDLVEASKLKKGFDVVSQPAQPDFAPFPDFF